MTKEIVRRKKMCFDGYVHKRRSSKAGRVKWHQSKRKKYFLFMMANKSGTVYRRIQMFPLKIFSETSYTSGKMFFTSGTHCWCWDQQLPLDFISWWVQGSLHRGATTCHKFKKKKEANQKTLNFRQKIKDKATLQYVPVCANPNFCLQSQGCGLRHRFDHPALS